MILIDEDTRVLVQGITGRQGRFHTKSMIEYGTNVVAGVTPGKAGEDVEGVPVYSSIGEVEEDPTAAILFVPARFAKAAVLEAIDAGLNPIIPITEHIPVHDSMYFVSKAREEGITVIGPNTPGAISVGECKMGIMPNHIFTKGEVAVISRSGTLTYEVVNQLTNKGIGQSSVIGLGGDPVTGLDYVTALKMLEEDDGTKAVVLIGEIGGSAEENAASYISENFSKPVVSYVAGASAPEGKTMGHAGAIVSKGSGTYESKVNALKDAGVRVAHLPKDVAGIVEEVL